MRAEELQDPPDEVLARRWQEGDVSAFELLFRRYRLPLFAFFYRLRGDHADAEELCQDFFLHLQRVIRSYDPTRRFSIWLYTVAANLGRDHLRRLKRRVEAEGIIAEAGHQEQERSTPTVLDTLVKRELEREVRDAVMRLEEDHRLVLVLRHYQGLTYKEIAEALGCPIGTVRSRIHYAVNTLKEELAQKGLLEQGIE